MTAAPTRVPLPPAFLALPIAHRALHDRSRRRPENSRAAVTAAVTAGYGIEIDVQPSADGQAMVFHDAGLGRLTPETGPLSAYSAKALGRIPLLGGDEGIPTLPEVLALIAGRAPLLIEIKDQTGGMTPTDGRLEAATVAALADYTGPVALMSFNPHAVEICARLAPALPRGLTTSAYVPADWAHLPAATCDRLRGIPDAVRTGAGFVSHEAADLARPRIAELAAAGLAILCWTIRSPEQEAAARRIARNITFEGYAAAVPA